MSVSWRDQRRTAAMSVRVLFLAGSGRSGSTILGKTLGNFDGFFDVGEIRQFWYRICSGEKLCGCGTRLQTCPFWAEVLSGLERDGIDPQRVAHLQSKLNRNRRVARVWAKKFHATTAAEWDELLAAMQRLYEHVAAGCRGSIIVDSSKLPIHLMLLRELAGIDLRVIHLVRDGRGVAYSCAKRRRTKPGHRSSYGGMALWVVENALIGQLLRRQPHWTMVRYEDFARRPKVTLIRALKELEMETDANRLEGAPIEIATTHSVAGSNRVRFAEHSQKIAVDQLWHDHVDPATKCLLTLMGCFTLRRYGYPWRA